MCTKITLLPNISVSSCFRRRRRMIWLSTHTFTGCNVQVNTCHYWQFVQWVENHLKHYIIRSRHKTSSMATFLSNLQLMANYLEPGYHNLLVLPFRLWVLLAITSFLPPHSLYNIVHQCQHIHETWLPVGDAGCCFSISSVSSSVHTKLSVHMCPSLSSHLWILPSDPPSPCDHFFFSFLVSAFLYIVCHIHCLLRQLRCCNFHWQIIGMFICSRHCHRLVKRRYLTTSYFEKHLTIRQFCCIELQCIHACV